jgi:putative membrane protein
VTFPSSAGAEPATPGDAPPPRPDGDPAPPTDVRSSGAGDTADVVTKRPADVSRPGTTSGPSTPAPTTADPTAPDPVAPQAIRSRTGATWVGLCLAAVVLVALIVFMLQNTTPVEVHFLGWSGTAPLALALLIAGVGVGLVALVVGTVRITQLRRRLGAARKAAGPGS